MITIDGISIDTTSCADDLMTEWALFIVEFEYDNKIMICHTFDFSVYRGIKQLMQYALDTKVGNLELRRSFLSSKYLTVDIIARYDQLFKQNSDMLLSEKKLCVLKSKYDYIKKYQSYYPCGYNILTDMRLRGEERQCANRLYEELIKDIDLHSLYTPVDFIVAHRGRPGKMVHKFSAQTGLFLETYNSVKEAAVATNTSPSNISACCSDETGKKTTGGFKWSYDRNVIFAD